MTRRVPWLISLSTFILYLYLLIEVTPASAKLSEWSGTYWCKCICFANYTILPLFDVEKPSQPCLTCTKKWCLEQELPTCEGAVLEPTNPDTATGKEGDVEARCFQRDSPRDQLVVTLFLIVVFGLLLGAAIKSRMGMVNWNSGNRRWWEVLLPSRQQENPYSLGPRTNGSRARSDGYVNLDTEETPSR